MLLNAIKKRTLADLVYIRQITKEEDEEKDNDIFVCLKNGKKGGGKSGAQIF